MDDTGQCGLCRRGLISFEGAYAAGAYEGKLRQLIHLYKYDRIQTLARPLAGYLCQALPRDERVDVVVPLPLHWRRRWQRGFNQADLLAREVARRFGWPLAHALQRRRATAVQAGLSGAQRRANVATAFTVPDPELVRGKHVLLIDDVLTTGATAGACAAALRRAEAKRVIVLTVARVDRRVRFSFSAKSLFLDSNEVGSLPHEHSGPTA